MTYHDQQPEYRLTWPEDHPLAGIEVVCKATTLAAALAVMEFDRRAERRKPAAPVLLALVTAFVEHVVSWNIRVAGRPVPVELAGFVMLDRDVVVAPLVRQWRDLVLDPPREQAAEPVEALVEDSVPDIEYELGATRLTDPVDGEQVVDGRPQDPVPAELDEQYVGDSWGVSAVPV